MRSSVDGTTIYQKKMNAYVIARRLEISSNHINNSGHKLSYSDTSLRNNIRKAQTLQD